MDSIGDIAERMGLMGEAWEETINKKIAEINHKSEERLSSRYKCSKCMDNGWVLKDDGGVVECECRKRLILETRVKKSGIAPELLEKSFDDFKVGDVQQLIQAKGMAMEYANHFLEFEHNRNNSFLLCGQVGAGKTHLGVAICNQLIKSGIEVLYIAYRSVITKLKQNIGEKEGYQKDVDRFIAARVLYIDDFLKGKITESDVNIVYEIINGRYMRNAPTIISTEKTPSELIRFDEAIGSRIAEMSKGRTVIFRGKELNHRKW